MTTVSPHSPIGASGMKRWKNCSGSVELSKDIESYSSDFADEGTEAHDLACKILVARRAGQPEPDMFDVSDEMIDAVNLYVDRMDELNVDDAIQLFEHRFHLKDIHPLCFGTADGVTYYPSKKLLVVSDLKYGSGVFVDVVQNDQLKYYALGAILTLKWPVHKIRIEIIQPRISFAAAIRPWEIDLFDLMEFADELLEAAKRTEEPNAPLHAGDWCRWCPAAAICPLIKDKALELTRRVYKKIPGQDKLDYEELGESVLWLPILKAWIASVSSFAYNEAMMGENIPGSKLVQKRPTRKWKNEDDAARLLANIGVPKDEIYKVQKKLITPAQVEKIPLRLVKANVKTRDGLKEYVGDLVVKVSSGFSLVPEKDDRKEANTVSAASVFTSRRNLDVLN